MISDQATANQRHPGSGREPTNVLQRRMFIGGGLAALLSACTSPTESRARLLSSSGFAMDEGREEQTDEGRDEGDVPNDPFIVVLKGRYQRVANGSGPNLGLTTVDLNDGSFSKVAIYPVFGIRGSAHQGKPIGTFYVSPARGKCAYDLPGGAIAMKFIAGAGRTFPVIVPDGMGGQYLEGSLPLTILEATGNYQVFADGHNTMVDKLHQLVAGAPFAGFPSAGYDELCFCVIMQHTTPSFP